MAVAVAALTKGYSGVPDSARLVHIFHAWCAGAQASVWLEYVPTQPNPADAPSRDPALASAPFRPAPGVVSRPVGRLIFPPLGALDRPGAWLEEARAACAPLRACRA